MFRSLCCIALPRAADMREQSLAKEQMMESKKQRQIEIKTEKCYRKCIENIKKASKNGKSMTYCSISISDNHMLLLKDAGYTVSPNPLWRKDAWSDDEYYIVSWENAENKSNESNITFFSKLKLFKKPLPSL